MSFTAKIKSVKGSLAASNYKANIEKGAELLKVSNLTGETVKERYEEKRAIARMNDTISKPFIEAVFSPHKSVSKNWTKEDWVKNTDEFCEKIGIPKDVPIEYYIHKNTATHHVHISASRINLIGKNVINDSFIGKKAESVCDKMAKKRNLLTAKELGKLEKGRMKNAIIETREKATSWEGFIQGMHRKGYHFELSTNKLGTNGARICNLEDLPISTARDDIKKEFKKGYKLSDIDRSLRVSDLEELFNWNKSKSQISEHKPNTINKSNNNQITL